MTWYPIAFLPPQYSDSAGTPYSGAVLKAYADGTTTVISMATGSDGATTATSFALNASGFPVSAGNAVIIPHIQEDYKLALYPDQASADADSGAIWTVDNINIADATGQSFLQTFSGDGTTTGFTLSTDLGTDEKTLMVFADCLREYSTNGAFATDTDWTKGTGWTITGGEAVATGAISTDLEQDSTITLIEGESYTVTMTITRTAGGVTPEIGGTAGTERTSAGTYTETIIAGSTQKIAFSGNGFTGTVDDVSVTRVNSTHREILRDDEFTLNGTSLTFDKAPAVGTNNILVFAPSQLLGEASASAAAAAISETNAASSAATAVAAGANTLLSYTFSTTTSMADPGTGILRFNNATISSVTAIAIDDQSAASGNPDLSAYIATWDDSTSNTKGTLRISKGDDPSVFAIFNITSLTDNSGWTQLAVGYVTGSGSLIDTDSLYLQFNPAGDAGTGLGSFTIDDFEDGTDFTAGTTTQLTLSTDPGNEANIDVSFDGIVQHHDAFTVSSTTLTFGTAIPSWVNKIEVKIGSSVSLNVPSDDSVTEAKHNSGSATSGQVLKADGSGGAAYGDGGKVLQMVYDDSVITTTLPQSGGQIPNDGTPPLITEGTEIFDVSITPKSATSRLVVDVELHFTGVSNNPNLVFSVWDDSTLIGATVHDIRISTDTYIARLRCFVSSTGGTTARDITVRAGPDSSSSNIELDDDFAAQKSSIMITEIST